MKSLFRLNTKKDLDRALRDASVVLVLQITAVIAFISFDFFGYTIFNLIDVLNLSILGYFLVYERNKFFGFLLCFYQLANVLYAIPTQFFFSHLIILLIYIRPTAELFYLESLKRTKKTKKAKLSRAYSSKIL